MGEAPLNTERVLLIFYQELPQELIGDIKRKFSDAELTIYKSRGFEDIPVPAGMPSGRKHHARAN